MTVVTIVTVVTVMMGLKGGDEVIWGMMRMARATELPGEGH